MLSISSATNPILCSSSQLINIKWGQLLPSSYYQVNCGGLPLRPILLVVVVVMVNCVLFSAELVLGLISAVVQTIM